MVKIPAKLEHYNIESLIPYERNSRIHSDEQIERIAASIQEFGFTNPILVDGEHGIIAGHGRLAAAKKLGMEKVPVIQLAHLSDAQKQAYIIADNRLAELSEWNKELLAEELAELQSFDFDLSLIGFDDASLAEIMPAEKELQPLTDEDDVPEVDEQATPKTKLGDVWILGSHRVMCGDSTDEAMVAKLMNGVKANLCLTDPPYGVKRDKGFGGFDGFGGSGTPIKRRTYKDDWDSEIPPRECFDLILQNCDLVIIFGGNFFAHILAQSKHWLVWDKCQTMPTFGDCELAWTNSERHSVKKYTVQYNGLIGKEKERFHPTQKPVKLFDEIISDYSEKENIVADFFLGSGSTLIACENTERKCYGMELSPQYIEVIIRRWQEYTGKEAHLEATGETFNSIASR